MPAKYELDPPDGLNILSQDHSFIKREELKSTSIATTPNQLSSQVPSKKSLSGILSRKKGLLPRSRPYSAENRGRA